jgi:hypothetical protein
MPALKKKSFMSSDSGIQKRLVVPFITRWGAEDDLPFHVVLQRGVGIAYADEVMADRDASGVLWHRTCSQPNHGRPHFGEVHSLRQRRAMRRLLCQVCGGPADQDNDGVLWLLPDHRADWKNWPEAMGNVEPPICRPCVGVSLRLCPRLRRDGGAAIRVRECPIVGVRGALYESRGTAPAMIDDATVAFDDPAIRWVRAVGLVRQLRGCRIVPLEELTPGIPSTPETLVDGSSAPPSTKVSLRQAEPGSEVCGPAADTSSS